MLDEPKEEAPAHTINLSETSDLCNLDSEVVDSPGGSSTESKKDDALAEDKKKRNKNKEGKHDETIRELNQIVQIPNL